MALSARKSRPVFGRVVLAAALGCSFAFGCSSDNDPASPVPSADSGPFTGDAALAMLRALFDEYAVNDVLCEDQIQAIAAAEFALLDPSGGGIPVDDPNGPYATYDANADGLILLPEFEAGQYAAAEANVNTDSASCITFEELRVYQDL
jgi:hypothetical protein